MRNIDTIESAMMIVLELAGLLKFVVVGRIVQKKTACFGSEASFDDFEQDTFEGCWMVERSVDCGKLFCFQLD